MYMPWENNMYILAKQDIQCGASRVNWNDARLVRDKTKRMKVDTFTECR